MVLSKSSKKVTKVGDLFVADITDKNAMFFQKIAIDKLQLGSDVIRVFDVRYDTNDLPDVDNIIHNNVSFYAHCDVKHGIKLNFWKHYGHSANIGNTSDIVFRDTSDYGKLINNDPILISRNWYIWRLNDNDFTMVGKIEDKYKSSHIGLVFNPLGIIEKMKGNKYPVNYPTP